MPFDYSSLVERQLRLVTESFRNKLPRNKQYKCSTVKGAYSVNVILILIRTPFAIKSSARTFRTFNSAWKPDQLRSEVKTYVNTSVYKHHII